ncbi:TRAP transporter small permease [Pseudaquabacterium rugosum]|jgi:TRAP-type transport system small permease protein|uniref:TRAP transporter small permease protein n=1 Tax=Pseudaquabacterium rugosum TaxID=2984194 RepID=A0ABU9BEH6_9BURK
MIDRLLRAWCRLTENLMALLMLAMVVLVFGNVVMRYAFDGGITISEELSRWFFVWMTFLGAAVGIYERAHLGTDMLLSRLKPGGRRALVTLSLLMMVGVTAVMLKGAWAQMQINLDVEAPVTGASMAWVYGAGVLFAAIALLLLVRELLLTVTGRISDAEIGQMRESEDLAQVDELHLDRSETFRKH